MDEAASGSQNAASPYSTGGGGVRLEHRLGALYLARLLSGGAVSQLGERPPSKVSFQQSPKFALDDLVLDSGEPLLGPSRQVQIAVRRAPKFVRSHADTSKLVRSLVQADLAVERNTDPSLEVTLAVAVAGRQTHTDEIALLATVARNQVSSGEFFALIGEPGKYAAKGRLDHLRDMVAAALAAIADPEAGTPEHRTWTMLSRLSIIDLDLEPGHGADWTAVADGLRPFALRPSPDGATALRDRLEQLAGEFAQTAATVDAEVLRRRLHGEIEQLALARAPGWDRLQQLDTEARSVVARALAGSETKAERVLPRRQVREALDVELAATDDLLVKGESGVGKSALVLDAVEPGTISEDTQAIVLNLRHLPDNQADLLSDLISSPEELFAELTAPNRILVIDSAEAAAERHGPVFAHLLRSARSSGMKVVAVAATEGSGSATEIMRAGNTMVRDYVVPALTDEEVAEAADHFPALGALASDPRGRELLRRPIVVELLGRAGDPGVPLSEAEALDRIWADLVRNGDRLDAGLPDKREHVMLRLAEHAIRPDDVDQLLQELDGAAVEGLRRSGLLLPASNLPWERQPAFKHDLVRAYSLARHLLANRAPAARLLEVEAPRWALPAARLACEILLSAPDQAQHPLAGRFEALQQGFDNISSAGHGARWADVPSEAVLAIARPEPVLVDAWPRLTQAKGLGLARMVRVLNARHRRNAMLDPGAAEPVIRQLLGANQLTRDLEDEVSELVCDWLRGLLVNHTEAGQSTRLELAKQIVAQCVERERVLDEQDAARLAALAARTPEEVAADEERKKQIPSIPILSSRRRRPEPARRRPYLWIEDNQIEQLALLGPDLGADGEAILRRIAEDDPHALEHAIEPLLAGNSLASYDVKLLLDLVSAFYIEGEDEDDDEFGFGPGLHDEGIRGHALRGGFGSPLFSCYYGPFLAMFQADFLGGIDVLNRMLNHAARHRVRIISNLGYGPRTSEEPDSYRHSLGITGEPRTFVGDGQVWLWYRGTGVGPYPCMSALQALEFIVEEYLRGGVRAAEVVPILLRGAESLAMPALALGILTRHLDTADLAIDPFLVEPLVWELEFSRAIGDQTRGYAAKVPGLKNDERRTWTLREACMLLNLSAEGERLDQLRQLGEQLITNAEAQVGDDSSQSAKEHLAAVRRWASTLDRSSYEFENQDGQLMIQQTTDPEIEAVLSETNEDLRRGNDAAGLSLRHAHVRDSGGRAPEMSEAELAADIATARDLVERPPRSGLAPEGPVAVAASVVELHFSGRTAVGSEDLEWSAVLLLQVAADVGAHPQDAFEDSFYSHGMDRSAGRALPFLLLPAAADTIHRLGDEPSTDMQELIYLSRAAATLSSNEARLAYARGLDAVWTAPCSDHLDGRCHHAVALGLVNDSYVDSTMGPWSQSSQRRSVARLDPPLAESLDRVPGQDIIVRRLGMGIRAAGAAAVSGACVRNEAAALLDVLIAAHQRAMLAPKHGHHHGHSESLVAARAALWQAMIGREDIVLTYVDRYLDNPRMLAEALQAIAVAGDETADAAEQAAVMWPRIMDRVLDALTTNPKIFNERTWGDYAESALIPNPAYAAHYLTSEMAGDPHPWRNLLAWSPQVERWLGAATGERQSLDHLVIAVRELDVVDQVEVGMRWLEALVRKAGAGAANTFTLPEWLHERRPDIQSDDQVGTWQRIVDFLVVAGDQRVADLAD